MLWLIYKQLKFQGEIIDYVVLYIFLEIIVIRVCVLVKFFYLGVVIGGVVQGLGVWGDLIFGGYYVSFMVVRCVCVFILGVVWFGGKVQW